MADEYKSIKLKEQTLINLKQIDAPGSYSEKINDLVANAPFTISKATMLELANSYDVDPDTDLDGFIKSYLVNKRDTRIKALSIAGGGILEAAAKEGLSPNQCLALAEEYEKLVASPKLLASAIIGNSILILKEGN